MGHQEPVAAGVPVGVGVPVGAGGVGAPGITDQGEGEGVLTQLLCVPEGLPQRAERAGPRVGDLFLPAQPDPGGERFARD
jgi:hypothetical protein